MSEKSTARRASVRKRVFPDWTVHDFKVEAISREVYDSTVAVGSGVGHRVVVSLPRLRWLEREGRGA